LLPFPRFDLIIIFALKCRVRNLAVPQKELKETTTKKNSVKAEIAFFHNQVD